MKKKKSIIQEILLYSHHTRIPSGIIFGETTVKVNKKHTLLNMSLYKLLSAWNTISPASSTWRTHTHSLKSSSSSNSYKFIQQILIEHL